MDVLPKEVVIDLGIKKGDIVCLVKGNDGSYRFSAADQDFYRQMEVASEHDEAISDHIEQAG